MCGDSNGCGGECSGSCATGETCSRRVDDMNMYDCIPTDCPAGCPCGQSCVAGECVNLCSPGTELCGCSACCNPAAEYCTGTECVPIG